MALKDAVLEIADMLEKEKYPVFATMLRMAVKAAENEAPANPHALVYGRYSEDARLSAEALARDQQDRAKDQEKKRETQSRIEEGLERMAYCVGGDSDGVMWPIPSDMPARAKTLIGEQVYILERDNSLHYSDTETIRYKEQAASKILTV